MLLRRRWFTPRFFKTHLFPRQPPFTFLPTDRLLDQELELIQPAPRWVDSVLAAAADPETRRLDPALTHTSRRQLADFLSLAPFGRQVPEPAAGVYPTYHFWMYNHQRRHSPIAGAVALRIGHGLELELYLGHFGYHVYPAHRGRHFAERAVRLLLPLAAQHGLKPVWITCNPDNRPSRRTCERLGAALIDTVAVPPTNPLFARGETAKCRYRLD